MAENPFMQRFVDETAELIVSDGFPMISFRLSRWDKTTSEIDFFLYFACFFD